MLCLEADLDKRFLWKILTKSYEVNPGIKISRLAYILSLAFVLKTNLQVPIGPCDKGGAALSRRQLVQAQVELEWDVCNPFFEQVEGRWKRTTCGERPIVESSSIETQKRHNSSFYLKGWQKVACWAQPNRKNTERFKIVNMKNVLNQPSLTLSWLMPVSSVQNLLRIGSSVGMTYEWKTANGSSGTLRFFASYRTAGNSMISGLGFFNRLSGQQVDSKSMTTK